MEVFLLMGRRGERRDVYQQTNPVKKFKLLLNSPLTNKINLVGRPTKIKWKMHSLLFRQRVVDLSFIATRISKNKALFWFCPINFDYYEKFCRKMFFFLSFFFRVYKKEKIHTCLKIYLDVIPVLWKKSRVWKLKAQNVLWQHCWKFGKWLG